MRTFAALFLAYVLSIFYRSFLSVIAERVMADLAIGPAQLSYVSAAWFIAFATMQFAVGWALDRVGPRRTVTALMAIGCAGAFLFAAAPNGPVATLAMALIGVGCSPVFMSALYLFARDGAPEKFALLSSLFIGLGSVGNLLGAAPLSRAADVWGWRPTMTGLAVLFGIALVLAAALVRDPPRLSSSTSKDDGLWSGLKGVMRLRVFWLVAPLTFFSYAILVTARGLWIAPYLGEVNGLDRAAQGDAALLMAITMTAGAFAFGWVERHLGGPKPTVFWSSAIMALLFAALALVGHRSGFWATILFAAIGFAGFNYAILMAHARLFFPEHLIGRGMTFMNFFFISGAAVVQAASGWLVEAGRRSGDSAAATFAQLHWVFAAALALSLVIYALAPAKPLRSATA
ncbi:MFS transporter [Terrarubrum flagellatum]|uniref:MFS transporter n=1 Tax=Terrirubrum flagellatum TaxID=2895980 RepID=UPI0031453CDD